MGKNATEIVKALRYHGHTHGSNPGIHLGICDEAADLIDQQQAENAELANLALEVTRKYETSVKIHGITTELLNKAKADLSALREAGQNIIWAYDNGQIEPYSPCVKEYIDAMRLLTQDHTEAPEKGE